MSCEERTKAMQVHKDKPLAGEQVFFGTRPARRGGGAHETCETTFADRDA